MKKLFLIILVFSLTQKICLAQDTSKYWGKLGNFLLESIELYPDSTFKWTREYDLSWSNYGTYEMTNSSLKLNYKLEFKYPETMSLKDTLAKIDTVLYRRKFLIEDKELFLLNSKDKKIRWRKNNFFTTRWSWLTFGFHKLKYIKIKQ